MEHFYSNSPSHTRLVFDPKAFRQVVLDTAKTIKILQKQLNFTTLAGCGNSGLPILGALQFELGLPIITIRKKSEAPVCGELAPRATGGVACDKYLIVEDCIATGGTVQHIVNTIVSEIKAFKESWKTHPSPPGETRIALARDPKCVGVLLYDTTYLNEIEVDLAVPAYFVYGPEGSLQITKPEILDRY